MELSIVITFVVAAIVTAAILYVIKVNRGNGHGDEKTDDNVPWEE